ncbi:MAG: hypothetical protein OEV72_06965, partial [Thermoleophilia bacterium]|nr:hypothetical protein [Thermoleophilia bacterium]
MAADLRRWGLSPSLPGDLGERQGQGVGLAVAILIDATIVRAVCSRRRPGCSDGEAGSCRPGSSGSPGLEHERSVGAVPERAAAQASRPDPRPGCG